MPSPFPKGPFKGKGQAEGEPLVSEIIDVAREAELALRRIDRAMEQFCLEVRASRIPQLRIKIGINRSAGYRFVRWKLDYRHVDARAGRLYAGRYAKTNTDAPAHVLTFLMRQIPARFHEQMIRYEERRVVLNRCRAAAYFTREYLQRALVERAEVRKLRQASTEE